MLAAQRTSTVAVPRLLRASRRPLAVSASSHSPAKMEKTELSGVPVYSTGAANLPAVIMMQEWWGVTDQVKAHGVRLAKSGFRVVIPDIYKGKIGVDKEEASHLMNNLDWMQALEEIKTVAAALKAAGSPKVGITGFCMGGALSCAGVQHSADISAAAPYYGIAGAQLFQPETVKKPVQLHFGAEDAMKGFSDPETAKQVCEKLKAAGADAELFVYPGVGHAFMNDSPAPYPSFEERQKVMGFAPYNSEQAELSWSRMTAFFKKHLA